MNTLNTDIDNFFIVHGILTVSWVVTSVVSGLWSREVIVYAE